MSRILAGNNIFGLREYYPLTPRPIPQMETGEPHPFTVLRRGDGWMELDAGAYTTAKVSFGFTAAAGACVKIIYAECVSVADAEGNRRKELRDAWNDPAARMEGVYDAVYATGKAFHRSGIAHSALSGWSFRRMRALSRMS